jgi:hypothetical protein
VADSDRPVIVSLVLQFGPALFFVRFPPAATAILSGTITTRMSGAVVGMLG